MKLLLDTHNFLWFVGGSNELSTPAEHLLEDGNNQLFLSVGSIWEMAIKISLGKLAAPSLYENFIAQQLSVNDMALLNISIGHTAELLNLPFHHRDPFDRLLIAQARIEQMLLVSRDAIFDAYSIQRVW